MRVVIPRVLRHIGLGSGLNRSGCRRRTRAPPTSSSYCVRRLASPLDKAAPSTSGSQDPPLQRSGLSTPNDAPELQHDRCDPSHHPATGTAGMQVHAEPNMLICTHAFPRDGRCSPACRAQVLWPAVRTCNPMQPHATPCRPVASLRVPGAESFGSQPTELLACFFKKLGIESEPDAFCTRATTRCSIEDLKLKAKKSYFYDPPAP